MREKSVAARLGISPGAIRDVREQQCIEGEHWEKRGRDIIWTEAGLQRLEEVVAGVEQKNGVTGRTGAESAEFTEVRDEVGGALAALLAPTLMRVRVRQIPRNPRMLIAEPVEKNTEVQEIRVRVRSNQNFLPGMELTARMEDRDLGVLEGRCPRYRGRY
jgi:hypothetical protein